MLIQDADLKYDPTDYDALLKPILSGKADTVFGSRFIGSHEHRVLYFWHSLGNQFLTLLSNMTTNLNLTYNWRDRIKAAFMGNFMGSTYAADNNPASRFIPAYNVWDLTVEAKVYKNTVSFIAGVNNIFNKDYYARIRADGIDPAAPRNWYAGVKVEF